MWKTPRSADIAHKMILVTSANDAVARGDCDSHGLAFALAKVAIEQAVAQSFEDIPLPPLMSAMGHERRPLR